jgi:hypothetical protein
MQWGACPPPPQAGGGIGRLYPPQANEIKFQKILKKISKKNFTKLLYAPNINKINIFLDMSNIILTFVSI